MADLVITESNVVPSSSITKTALINSAQVGKIASGDLVVQAADQTILHADATNNDANVYMAVSAGYADQTISLWQLGNIDLGSVLTQGVFYYLSATAGKIAPYADLLTGEYIVQLGVAVDADTLNFKPWVTNIAVP